MPGPTAELPGGTIPFCNNSARVSVAQKASSEPLWQPLASAHHLMLQSLRKQQRGDHDSESCADRKQKGKKLQSSCLLLPVDGQSISVLAGHAAGPGGLWPHVGCFSEREGLPGPWCCRDWPLTLLPSLRPPGRGLSWQHHSADAVLAPRRLLRSQDSAPRGLSSIPLRTQRVTRV